MESKQQIIPDQSYIFSEGSWGMVCITLAEEEKDSFTGWSEDNNAYKTLRIREIRNYLSSTIWRWEAKSGK